MTNTALRTHTPTHTDTYIYIDMHTPRYWLPPNQAFSMSGQLKFSLLCACASVVEDVAHHVLMSCCVAHQRYITYIVDKHKMTFCLSVSSPDVEVSKQYAGTLFIPWECGSVENAVQQVSCKSSLYASKTDSASQPSCRPWSFDHTIRTLLKCHWAKYRTTSCTVPLQGSRLTLSPLRRFLEAHVFNLLYVHIYSVRSISCVQSEF